MNKKLMAVAVASALGAPGLAVAQVGSSPGITLYGRLDSAILQVSGRPSTTSTHLTRSDLDAIPHSLDPLFARIHPRQGSAHAFGARARRGACRW